MYINFKLENETEFANVVKKNSKKWCILKFKKSKNYKMHFVQNIQVWKRNRIRRNQKKRTSKKCECWNSKKVAITKCCFRKSICLKKRKNFFVWVRNVSLCKSHSEHSMQILYVKKSGLRGDRMEFRSLNNLTLHLRNPLA